MANSVSQIPEEQKGSISNEMIVELLTGITLRTILWDVDKDTGDAVPRGERATAVPSKNDDNAVTLGRTEFGLSNKPPAIA